ncbi:MAG: zinc ribbon domain-containing protein [Ignavibacterium sp.]|nr:zinc ribbon domain-containing protein [Ignavibacterium sp.]
MPIFEYKCEECNSKFELLHKSSANNEEITCPFCKSVNNKKLFSAFSASVTGNSSYGDSCSTGSCGTVPSYGGCASGMCGLN